MNLTREEVSSILAKSTLAPRNKYGVARKDQRTCDNVTFASKHEMNYYRTLRGLVEQGVVKFFLRQVPFHLPGHTQYRADFLAFYTDGHFEVIDAKGARTEIFRLKRRQVEELYPVTIREV